MAESPQSWWSFHTRNFTACQYLREWGQQSPEPHDFPCSRNTCNFEAVFRAALATRRQAARVLNWRLSEYCLVALATP
ncbi:hypothetical protein NDU88_005729 [Pleurodeles waltl]|uniref:Uncharacterized protein n=1 Tax=Pleurodeles waltl TaxID=8319 RepID=A0AAV7WZH7_PLEWA|nr:hypothetical protein NDU88_005729 [Pleurodeles waltl]